MDKKKLSHIVLPDETRRKVLRGGLAAPIVLGSLTSKQVLAGGSYHCGVSGKMSGGSGHGPKQTCKTGHSCKDLQNSCNYEGYTICNGKWKKDRNDEICWDQNNDPNPYKCGKKMHDLGFVDHKCFNRFKKSNGGWCLGKNNSGSKRLTSYECLFLDKNKCSESSLKLHAELAREAACAYYNASQNLSPLTCNDVKNMTNDCLQSGRVILSNYFNVADTSKSWTMTECIQYFQSLRRDDEYCGFYPSNPFNI
jgi:hypothetical protein